MQGTRYIHERESIIGQSGRELDCGATMRHGQRTCFTHALAANLCQKAMWEKRTWEGGSGRVDYGMSDIYPRIYLCRWLLQNDHRHDNTIISPIASAKPIYSLVRKCGTRPHFRCAVKDSWNWRNEMRDSKIAWPRPQRKQGLGCSPVRTRWQWSMLTQWI